MDNSAKPNQTSSRAATLGGALSVLANLIWLAQAWVIATVLAVLLSGDDPNVWLSALSFLGLGVLRSLLNLQAQAVLSQAAEAEIQPWRLDIAATEAATAGVSRFGGAGSIAGVCATSI